MRDDSSRRPRLVVLSPVLPHSSMDNAGGRYVQALQVELSRRFDVVFVCPDVPVNREALTREGRPAVVHLVGTSHGHPMHRVLYAVAHRAAVLLARADVTAPSLPFGLGLAIERDVRTLLRRADVIDVQWSELIRLAPLVRVINRRATLIGTFHDVLSQRYGRYARARERSAQPWVWRLSSVIAARSERAAQRRFDAVIALSDKDRVLLEKHTRGRRSALHVIDPPMYDGRELVREPADRPLALFVGSLSRDDNIDAVEWLLSTVWPRVRDLVPDIRLRIVGGGAHDRVTTAVAGVPGVELTGFVDDLDAEYAAAWVALIPLRIGAGIKFKTIEALVAGVPVITTSVGAEGIGERPLYSALVDEAPGFAQAIAEVIQDPDSAQADASIAAAWARNKYSTSHFTESVGQVYAHQPPRDGATR